MEENKNVLDKWFYFREEELETNLSEEDKEHLYYFEKHTNPIVDLLEEQAKAFVKGQLSKLEEEILDSTEHFNRKYYMAGFMDAVGILWKI